VVLLLDFLTVFAASTDCNTDSLLDRRYHSASDALCHAKRAASLVSAKTCCSALHIVPDEAALSRIPTPNGHANGKICGWIRQQVRVRQAYFFGGWSLQITEWCPEMLSSVLQVGAHLCRGAMPTSGVLCHNFRHPCGAGIYKTRRWQSPSNVWSHHTRAQHCSGQAGHVAHCPVVG
jgi:hypothetical protein